MAKDKILPCSSAAYAKKRGDEARQQTYKVLAQQAAAKRKRG